MNPKPANSLLRYLPLFISSDKKVVLDYGSGNLRNSIFLHRYGYQVYAVDLPQGCKLKPMPRLRCILPNEIAKIKTRIDVVICTFVLNLLSPPERILFADTVTACISTGGYLLIETRGLSQLELDMLVMPRGFCRVDAAKGRYTLISLYQYLSTIKLTGGLN